LLDIPKCIDPALSYLHRIHDVPLRMNKSVVCVTSIAWHPDGLSFAAGCNHGVVLVFNTAVPLRAHPQLSYTITTGDSGVDSVAFSPCGLLLCTTHVSGAITVFEASHGGQLVLALQEPVSSYVANASKHRVADWIDLAGGQAGVRYLLTSSASPSDITLRRISQRGTAWQNTIECRLTLPAPCTAAVVHPSQEYLLATSHDGSLHIFHLPDGECRGQVKLPGSPPDGVFIDVDHSGLYLLVATVRGQVSTLALVEIGTGEIAWQQAHLPQVHAVAFAPGASSFLTATDGGVLVWALQGEVAATAERVAAACSRSAGFWARYPIDLRAVPGSTAELSPRDGDEGRNPTLEGLECDVDKIANFVEAVSCSNAQVQAAAQCLDSARTWGSEDSGIVGSYAGSDGTADSIEILDALRQRLDAAEDRDERRHGSPGETVYLIVCGHD
jgi:WD40 repeat protein